MKIIKEHLTFNFADISTYRTQLMGIATLMIIACHAPASHVEMPRIVGQILSIGDYGVDFFLLLSGLGLYYSLDKQSVTCLVGWKNYIKKRFFRIFIPYLMIYFPYCIFMMLLRKYSLEDSLLCVTALEYWVYHRGAWFVSLILVLYIFSPLLYRLLKSKGKWLYVVLILVVIMSICNHPSIDVFGRGITSNVVSALGRVPSFILGMAVGNASKKEKHLSVLWLLLPIVIYVICIKGIFINKGITFMLIPLMVYFLVLFLRLIKNVKLIISSFYFLGKISLESYLTNITINSLLHTLIPVYISSHLFKGRWIEYFIVVVFGLIIADYVNKKSSTQQKYMF